MADESTLRLSFLAASFFVVSLFASWYRRDPLVSPTPFGPSLPVLIDSGRSQLEAIPVVGFSHPILSYFSALRFIFDGVPMLKYGYEKVNASVFYHMVALFGAGLMLRSVSQTRPGLFRIARLRRWMVLASGPELIEDVRKAPENVLSMSAANNEVHMFPRTLDSYPYTFSSSSSPNIH